MESHAGQVFTCVGALALADSLHLLDRDLLCWWCVSSCRCQKHVHVKAASNSYGIVCGLKMLDSHLCLQQPSLTKHPDCKCLLYIAESIECYEPSPMQLRLDRKLQQLCSHQASAAALFPQSRKFDTFWKQTCILLGCILRKGHAHRPGYPEV